MGSLFHLGVQFEPKTKGQSHRRAWRQRRKAAAYSLQAMIYFTACDTSPYPVNTNGFTVHHDP